MSKQRAAITAAIAIAGSGSQLARSLDRGPGSRVTPGNVNDWLHDRRKCPIKHLHAIGVLIGRNPLQLIAEVHAERVEKSLASVLCGALAMLLICGAAGDARSAVPQANRADV